MWRRALSRCPHVRHITAGKAAHKPPCSNGVLKATDLPTPAISSSPHDTQLTMRVPSVFRKQAYHKKHVPHASEHIVRSLLSFPAESQARLVTSVAFWASRYQLMVPLEKMVSTFLSLSQDPTTQQYNVFLRVLTQDTRSRQTCRYAQRVLMAMLERGHRVTRKAYLALLQPKFAVPGFAALVIRHMKAQGSTPSLLHLHCATHIHIRDGTRPVRFQRRPVFLIRPAASRERALSAPTEDIHPNAGDDVSHVSTSDTFSDDSLHPLTAHALSSSARIRSVLSDAVHHGLSTGRLIRWFRSLVANGEVPPSHMLGLYVFLITQLLFRGEYMRAANMWKEIRGQTLCLDGIAVSVGVRVLTLAGEELRAVDLLEEAYDTMRSSPQTIQRTRTGLRPALPLISAPTLAGLMDALFQRGRDDLVFFLWDNMEMLYGVSPNIYAFNIMLKVARRSKMHNMSIRNAFVQLGLFRRPSTWSPLDEIADPRARLAASFRMSLEQPPTQTGLWDGYPAHRIALRVVTHHLLCLWPELLEIEGPVYALRETGDRLVSHPFTEFAHAMQTYASTQFHHPSPPRLLALVGPPPKKPTYYNVVPNEKSFHLLIHLLDTNDLASEIPLVLAWMRHLSIIPSQWTIAFALVYWRPVSTDSPLLEAMKGGLGRSPYGRLVGWLTAWLGEKGVPSDRLIGKAMRSVEYFKTSNPIFEDKPEKR